MCDLHFVDRLCGLIWIVANRPHMAFLFWKYVLIVIFNLLQWNHRLISTVQQGVKYTTVNSLLLLSYSVKTFLMTLWSQSLVSSLIKYSMVFVLYNTNTLREINQSVSLSQIYSSLVTLRMKNLRRRQPSLLGDIATATSILQAQNLCGWFTSGFQWQCCPTSSLQ